MAAKKGWAVKGRNVKVVALRREDRQCNGRTTKGGRCTRNGTERGADGKWYCKKGHW